MWQSASEPADAPADLMTSYQRTRIKPENVASPKNHSRKAVGIDYPKVFSQEEKRGPLFLSSLLLFSFVFFLFVFSRDVITVGTP